MAIRVGCASAWKISALNRRNASGMSLIIFEYPNIAPLKVGARKARTATRYLRVMTQRWNGVPLKREMR
jgi:hypothetical protein